MDPLVIALPKPLRYVLVKNIARTRCRTSAQAYESIWTDTGGPLRDHANLLADRVRDATELPVAVGMRYGEPNFEDAYASIKDDCDELLVVTAFPQYAASTYGTAVEQLRKVIKDKPTWIMRPFFNDAGFLAAYRSLLQQQLPDDIEHLLFSFHGIPELHLRRADVSRQHCLKHPDCCEGAHATHATCYRHQCLATARALSEVVSVPATVAFQSRLGRAKWLQPYTVDTIRNLANAGIRKLAVTCPSFISDHLETLYEIGEEMRLVFLNAGGTRLDLLPCLNEFDPWVTCVISWCRQPLIAHAPLHEA